MYRCLGGQVDNYKLGYYFLNSCLQHYLNCSGTKAIELKIKTISPLTLTV